MDSSELARRSLRLRRDERRAGGCHTTHGEFSHVDMVAGTMCLDGHLVTQSPGHWSPRHSGHPVADLQSGCWSSCLGSGVLLIRDTTMPPATADGPGRSGRSKQRSCYWAPSSTAAHPGASCTRRDRIRNPPPVPTTRRRRPERAGDGHERA